jgi:hypothetical protein
MWGSRIQAVLRASVGPDPRTMAHTQGVDQSLILRPRVTGCDRKLTALVCTNYLILNSSRSMLLIYCYSSWLQACGCSNLASHHGHGARLYVSNGRPTFRVNRTCRPPHIPLFRWSALSISGNRTAPKLKWRLPKAREIYDLHMKISGCSYSHYTPPRIVPGDFNSGSREEWIILPGWLTTNPPSINLWMLRTKLTPKRAPSDQKASIYLNKSEFSSRFRYVSTIDNRNARTFAEVSRSISIRSPSQLTFC